MLSKQLCLQPPARPDGNESDMKLRSWTKFQAIGFSRYADPTKGGSVAEWFIPNINSECRDFAN